MSTRKKILINIFLIDVLGIEDVLILRVEYSVAR